MEKISHFPDWIFYVSLLVSLLLGVLHFRYPVRFKLFLRVPVSGAFIHQYYDESDHKTDLFHVLNESQFFLVASLVLSVGLYNYTWHATPAEGIVVFLKLLIGLLFIFFLQSFLNSIIGTLLHQNVSFPGFQFRKIIIRNWSALVSFPLLIMGYYLDFANNFFQIAAISVLGLGYLLGLIQGGYYLTKNANLQSLHIFLYLCGLEILPLLILVKAL